ncbi:hypothetical protein MFLAVUS_009700 [Mucor flavus]|uniref:Kinase-like protein n=1 Tax=Mucor flavus TaxID=439312 RepID=A0ABP9ZAV2_9FUNG
MPVATATSNQSWSNSSPADSRVAVIETVFITPTRPYTLHKHFPKQRVPLPKLTEAFSIQKKPLFSIKKRKSNAKLLETYLVRCINSPIGHSSLFRDFLSAQRDEDKVASKSSIEKLVVHHFTQTEPVEQEMDGVVTPARSVTNQTSTSSSCQQYRYYPPSPPLSTSNVNTSAAEFPDNGHHSNLMVYSSIIEQEEEEEEKRSTPAALKDYQLIKVLGKGATGKVILVRHQTSQKLYALKSMTKAWHITEREVTHIRTERNILAKIAEINHPFLMRLHRAFQDHQNLYLVLDYHAGADLSTLLQRCHSIPAKICRIYAAEIMMGLQELHRHAILYRDLKPENVLVAADGHLVLTDFGLSKMFEDSETYYHRTATYCGTPDYMAPEIILQEEEYSYAADYWSFGTMLFEMLTGVTPFAAKTLDEMYLRVLFDDLTFPANFDPDAADLITNLLRRDPFTRLSDVFNVRTHPYFTKHLDWKDVHAKRVQPSYVPALQSETDLCNFDPDFLNMSLAVDEEDSSLYRQRLCPDTRPAGLEKDAFHGYSYTQVDEGREITYQSELSFSTDEYISEDDEEDAEYYRMAEQALIDSLALNLPVRSASHVSQTGLKRSLRPTATARPIDASTFNYNQDMGTHRPAAARSIDASAFNYNQDIYAFTQNLDLPHRAPTYDTNDSTDDLIDQLFDVMQVPSFARDPVSPSSKKDLKCPTAADRSNGLDPVPFDPLFDDVQVPSFARGSPPKKDLKRRLSPAAEVAAAGRSKKLNLVPFNDMQVPSPKKDLKRPLSPTAEDAADRSKKLNVVPFDPLFDDMQVPSFASPKKNLKRRLSPTAKASSNRSNRLDPVPFNYNQNIRNSKIMNSTIKDDDASTWRS